MSVSIILYSCGKVGSNSTILPCTKARASVQNTKYKLSSPDANLYFIRKTPRAKARGVLHVEAETRGFEPLCRVLPGNSISSRARYGLFGTSPYIYQVKAETRGARGPVDLGSAPTGAERRPSNPCAGYCPATRFRVEPVMASSVRLHIYVRFTSCLKKRHCLTQCLALGYKDSNLENDGVRVRCLTIWL